MSNTVIVDSLSGPSQPTLSILGFANQDMVGMKVIHVIATPVLCLSCYRLCCADTAGLLCIWNSEGPHATLHCDCKQAASAVTTLHQRKDPACTSTLLLTLPSCNCVPCTPLPCILLSSLFVCLCVSFPLSHSYSRPLLFCLPLFSHSLFSLSS